MAGLMPHPERASEVLMGGLADGRLIFDSMIAALTKVPRQTAA